MKKITFLCAIMISASAGYGTHRKVAVIGTGYVGLIQATGVAECGHTVIAADIDNNKINLLNAGKMPIYEQGLETLAHKHSASGRLSFTSDIAEAIRKSEVIFIAVGTPMATDGTADLSAIYDVARTIATNIDSYKVIVIKSTVPPGTGSAIQVLIEGRPENKGNFQVLSNPEFLSQGSAVNDFLNPDRIVIGGDSRRALNIMHDIYKPLIAQGVTVISTDRLTAELIKYASNAALALKLSFINEIARLADAIGADVELIAQGIGSDKRIGPYFLKPGPGFGGSCFPKDCNALVRIAEQNKIELKTIGAALAVNTEQREYVVTKLENLLDGQLDQKTIAVLGLAFKANTDDVRESPAIDIIKILGKRGAHVRAYDPLAMGNALRIMPELNYASSALEAASGADAIVILTEWAEFRTLDLNELYAHTKGKILVDARNLYDAQELERIGFKYATIGRPLYHDRFDRHQDGEFAPDKKDMSQE